MRRILNFFKAKAVKAKSAVIGFFRNTGKNIREDFTPAKALTDAQRDAKRIRAVRRITAGLTLASMMMSVMGVTAFAEGTGGSEGVDTFNTVVEFIVDWVARIGLVIGFIGAVQFAMGFKDDSADGKTRGLMCLASGFIVFAVAKAYDMFTA
ncbi:MAG: hypothetical protein J1F04_09235 [Oscillospiraceae bacterium]|nr:hypothetical protein [Oscillospiraceae bacterium]